MEPGKNKLNNEKKCQILYLLVLALHSFLTLAMGSTVSDINCQKRFVTRFERKLRVHGMCDRYSDYNRLTASFLLHTWNLQPGGENRKLKNVHVGNGSNILSDLLVVLVFVTVMAVSQQTLNKCKRALLPAMKVQYI